MRLIGDSPVSSPIVSVIVAAYEAADFVEAAISSARAQTLAEIEIIVVDDASRDATRAVVASIARDDPRVRLVPLAVNGGPGAARNAALAHATGVWVAVLDADDRFAPDRLERLLALATETGADIVSDNLLLESPSGSGTLLPDRGLDPFEINAVSFIAANRGRRNQGRVLLGFLKPVIRRELLIRHGLGYEPLRLAEDYFLGLDCLVCGARWFVTRAPMYHYAVRDGSLTATFTPDHLDAMARADRRLLAKPRVRAQPKVERAIRHHLAAVTRAATWTRFVHALRARQLRAATRIALTDARSGWAVLSEGCAAAPRFLRRGIDRAGLPRGKGA